MSTPFRPGVLAALIATSVHAQETTTPAPQRIEITGQRADEPRVGKSDIPLERVPQSLQLLQADELLRQGVASIGEALRDVPGANAGQSRVTRYQSFSLKVRGFFADQARNGLRQRYHEDIDASALSNIERLDVLKGPSSVLFGHSAVGGLIGIVTKQPQPVFGAEVAVTGGSHQRRQLMADLTGPLDAEGRWQARLVAEVERSGTFVDHQFIDRDNLAFTLQGRPSNDTTLHLVTEVLARRTLGHPGLPVDGTVSLARTAALPRSLYLGEPTQSPLRASGPLVQAWADVRLGEDWTLTPRLQYQAFDTSFTQIRVRALGADGFTLARNGRQGVENDRYLIAQLDLKGRGVAAGLTHQLLAGVEWNDEHSTFRQHNLDNVGAIDLRAPVYTYSGGLPPTASFAFASTGDVRGPALYLQDRIALTPALELLLGLRHSQFQMRSVFNGAVDNSRTQATTGQLGATWSFAPGWTAFGGWNTGLDLEAAASGRNAQGQPFKPERSAQLEAGLRARHGAWQGSAALFQVRRTDALTTDPLDPDFLVQTGEQRVRGVELEGRWTPAPGWQLQGGLAWMKGEVTRSNDGDAGAELGDTPRRQATLNLAHQLADSGWTLRVGANAVSARTLVTGSAVRLAGYALLDLGLNWRGGPWSLDLTLNNALDRRYFTASGNAFAVYPGDPRQLALRLGYRS